MQQFLAEAETVVVQAEDKGHSGKGRFGLLGDGFAANVEVERVITQRNTRQGRCLVHKQKRKTEMADLNSSQMELKTGSKTRLSVFIEVFCCK